MKPIRVSVCATVLRAFTTWSIQRPTHRLVLVLTALAALFALDVRAQFGPGAPTALHSNAGADTESDFTPRVATDRNGVWIAVWSSRENLAGSIGSDADILMARSTNNGATWSSPQALNNNAGSDSGEDFAPRIATDAVGRWIVAWHSDDNLGGINGTERDILFSTSSDNGLTWSPVRSLNNDAGTDLRPDSDVSIAFSGSGAWLAAWHGADPGGDQDIFFARSIDGGASWSTPARLNINGASDLGNDFGVSLAADAQGNCIATWSSTEDLAGPSDSDSDIAYATSADNGASWSAPAFLHASATTDDGEDFQSQVVSDGNGTWLVIWESGASLNGTVGSDQDILCSKSTDLGATWSAPTPVNQNAGTDTELDSFPAVSTDGAGVWVAVWHSQEDPGGTANDQDVLVAYSTDFGNTWSAPAPLAANATTDSGADSNPHLANDAAGHWVAVWASEDSLGGTIGTDGDILFVTVVNPLFWTRPAELNNNASTDSGSDFLPKVATDAKGNWIAVWMSSENLNGTAGTDFDILFSRSTDNGITWSAPAVLNSNANTDSGDDRDPRIATDTQGRWLAVWGSNENLNGQTGNDGDILFSVSTNQGASWSAPIPLNTAATNDALGDFNPAIATDRSGQWVVVWGTSGAFGNDFDVLVSTSADGSTWSAPAPLNSNAATDDGDDFEPVVATDGLGQWIAVWMSNSELTGLGYNLGTDDDILVAYSSDNGASWTSPRPLNSNAAVDGGDDDDYSPQLATDRAGNWIVVWPSEGTLAGTLATNFNILYTRSTDNGGAWSPPAALNLTAVNDTGDDRMPQIAVDANGRWLVTWHSNERALGGVPGGSPEHDIAVATSFDAGATWSPPNSLQTDGFVEDSDDANAHLAVGAGGTWIVVWSSMPNLLGVDSDVRFARAFVPMPSPAAILPLQVVNAGVTGAPPGGFLIQWSGGVPPFQIQSRTNLAAGNWVDAGGLLCERFATFPLSALQQFFRVLSLGNAAAPRVDWVEPASYFHGAADAVAQKIFVSGFGIDDTVNILTSGDLPLTVQRTIINNSRVPVPAGYTVTEQLQGWTFLAVGGAAGYLPGSALQLAFDCETTNTPALAPGQTAVITFELGGAGCAPTIPIVGLPCGLYQESMTIVAPSLVSGLCTNTTDIVASEFLFVNSTNRIQIAATLDPNNDPNVSVQGTTAVVLAVPDTPVHTHQLNITVVPSTLSYFVRGRSPIFGAQAPTMGVFVPAISQAPAPPTTLTGNQAINYFVTVVPAYNGIPSCNVFGIPSFYQEMVNTTLTAISMDGCTIAQESVQATGIYECNF